MDTQVTTETGGFVDLVAAAWDSSRSVALEKVARDMTVGEMVTESAKLLELPVAPYHAVFRGRQLNNGDTLDEVGVKSRDRVELVPEVSAGASRGAPRLVG